MARGENVEFDDSHFLSDAPIGSVAEDRYGHSGNAAALANAIRETRTDESFVIGLSGEWGSGKTSFINMVCEDLTHPKNGGAATSVVAFNPWLIEDRKALLGSFFTALASALPEHEERHTNGWRNNLSGLLLQYSSVLTEGSLAAAVNLVPQLVDLGANTASVAGPVLLGTARFISNKLANKLQIANPSLDDLRKQICEQLGKLDANIVVVIDDIDRLSSDEIRLIFKLVTLSASFPRITYLLSFDKEVVATALAEVQGIDGGRYLEKVVQLDVEIPPLSLGFVTKQINDRLSPLLGKDKFYEEGRDGERLRAIYQGLIVPTLNTPRKVTRYINHVLSKFWAISDEVCLVDILGLAAIELYSPEVFEVLWGERDLICKGGQSTLLVEERKQHLKSLKEAVDKGLPHELYRDYALAALFPKFPSSPLDMDASMTAEVARAEGRICCLDLFSYYRGGYYLPVVSWEEAKNLVMNAGERSLSDAFMEAIRDERLIEFCNIIGGHFDGLSAERALCFARPMLFSLGKSDECYRALLMQSRADEELTRLLRRIATIAGTNRFSSVLADSLPRLDADNLVGLVWLIGDELNARDEETEDDESQQGIKKVAVLTDEAFDELLRNYCETLETYADDVVKRADFVPFTTWRLASERIESDSYNRFIESIPSEPKRYLLYQAGQLGESFSSGRYAHCYGGKSKVDDLDVGLVESAVRDSGWLRGLRTSAREKVAALYLLCAGSKDVHEDYGVPDWAARDQLARWGV